MEWLIEGAPPESRVHLHGLGAGSMLADELAVPGRRRGRLAVGRRLRHLHLEQQLPPRVTELGRRRDPLLRRGRGVDAGGRGGSFGVERVGALALPLQK